MERKLDDDSVIVVHANDSPYGRSKNLQKKPQNPANLSNFIYGGRFQMLRRIVDRINFSWVEEPCIIAVCTYPVNNINSFHRVCYDDDVIRYHT